VAIYLVSKSGSQAGRAVLNRSHVINVSPPFGTVIFRVDAPILQVRFPGNTVTRVEKPARLQNCVDRMVDKFSASAWFNAVQPGSNVLR